MDKTLPKEVLEKVWNILTDFSKSQYGTRSIASGIDIVVGATVRQAHQAATAHLAAQGWTVTDRAHDPSIFQPFQERTCNAHPQRYK